MRNGHREGFMLVLESTGNIKRVLSKDYAPRTTRFVFSISEDGKEYQSMDDESQHYIEPTFEKVVE